MKKYELTSEFKFNVFGVKVFQIKALIEIKQLGIETGDLGGFIEKESNLSQQNNAWVYGNAQVYGDAWVSGDALVCDNARVSGNAHVFGDAQVCGNARVSGDAQVYGDAWVYGNAQVSSNAQVYGDARVYGNAQVSDNALVYGNARVYGNAKLESVYCIAHIQTIKYGITATNIGISIGCELHSYLHWLKEYKSIGVKHSFTDKECEHFLKLIKTINKIYIAQQELKKETIK